MKGGDFNVNMGVDNEDDGMTGIFGNPYRNDRGKTLYFFSNKQIMFDRYILPEK